MLRFQAALGIFPGMSARNVNISRYLPSWVQETSQIAPGFVM